MTLPRPLRLVLPPLVVGGALLALWLRENRMEPDAGEQRETARAPRDTRARENIKTGEALSPPAWTESLADTLRARFNQPGHRSGEALLVFKDEAARLAFLARAAEAGAEVLGVIPGLNAVRIRAKDYDRLAAELGARAADYASVGGNPLLGSEPPPVEAREARDARPVGTGLLQAVGVRTAADPSWGRGVVVAVLDGGAAAGAGTRYLDIGYGIAGPGEDSVHGTAVAGLVAAVAPAADLLSVRVTGPDGASDAFAVAQGIYAAVEAGARVINISLGGHATSPVLGEAIEYAIAAGAAVVAAAGNDQAAALAWPAAYPGVVSVGATDATGRQAIFSNSGEGLQLTAPGYAVQTTGPSGEAIIFSGTSASAPVVAGALATVLSRSPSLSPAQAADILASHANDGGAAGADNDYGRGTLNLGWALERDNPARQDPAISGQGYDARTGAVSVVVQNRGSTTLSGLAVDIALDGDTSRRALAELPPGASATVTVPARILSEGESLKVISRLALPSSLTDTDESNNSRGGVVNGIAASP